MVKNHIKSIAAPKTWPVERKKKVFLVRPDAGPHSLKTSISLNFALIELLKHAKTKKEVKYILTNKEVLVDGTKRKSLAFPVGLFDVIAITDIKKNYRITLDKKGKLKIIDIDEKDSKIKPCKIMGKTTLKGKIQLNLSDGRNLITDSKDYKVGDSVVMDLQGKKAKECLKLEKGCAIFMTGGKNIGTEGIVEDIIKNKIIYRGKDGVNETLKEYAYVIGKEKPIIKTE